MKPRPYPAESNNGIVQPLRDDDDSVFAGVDRTTPITDVAVTDGDRHAFASYVPTALVEEEEEDTCDSDDESTIPR